MGGLRYFVHLQEPLVRESGFGGGVGVALRISHLVFVIFNLFNQAGGFKVFGDLLAHLETVHAHIHSGSFAYRSVVVEYVDGFKIVFCTEHVVVHVVGGSYLEAACTEFNVDIVVLDYRYLTIYEGNNHALSAQMCIFRVVGVDAHSGVAHYCFRTSGGYHGITVLTYDVITQVVELAVLLLIYYFYVAECGACFGVPVHHSLSAIDESLAIEFAENLDDALGADVVHGESRAAPVA